MSVQARVIGIANVAEDTTSRGPIFRITTSDNVEYATFNGQMAHQARQLVGQVVQLRYSEKDVYKNGQTYTNRYYEGAEGTGQQLTLGAAPMTQPNFGSFGNAPSGVPPAPMMPDQRTKQIHRQTASKVAAQMLVYLPQAERTPDGLVAIAEYLVSYYEDGPRRAAPEQAPTYYTTDYATAPPTDDDIPF